MIVEIAMTTTTMTWTERVTTGRATVAANLTSALTARGFTVAPTYTGHTLKVSKAPVGELAELDFYSARLTDAGVMTGEVRLSARGPYTRGRSAYKLDATGFVNVNGLVKRLTSEIGKIAAWLEAGRTAREREKADDALLASFGVLPKNVEMSIYGGEVDLKLRDLTPSRAALVLKALTEGA
jgi:hypothetical protein